MEQKPPVPPQHETQSPTKRQEVEAAHAAMRNANVAQEKRTVEEFAERFALKVRREGVREEREQDDGTKKIVEVRQKVSLPEEEWRQRAKEGLGKVLQRSPTGADYEAGIFHYDPLDAGRQEYERIIKDVHEGLDKRDYEPLFAALGQRGPRLLLDPRVNDTVEGWWLNQTNDNISVAEQEKEKQFLKRIGTVLSLVGSGRTREVTAEMAQQIFAIYDEEYARCCTVRGSCSQIVDGGS